MKREREKVDDLNTIVFVKPTKRGAPFFALEFRFTGEVKPYYQFLHLRLRVDAGHYFPAAKRLYRTLRTAGKVEVGSFKRLAM